MKSAALQERQKQVGFLASLSHRAGTIERVVGFEAADYLDVVVWIPNNGKPKHSIIIGKGTLLAQGIPCLIGQDYGQWAKSGPSSPELITLLQFSHLTKFKAGELSQSAPTQLDFQERELIHA